MLEGLRQVVFPGGRNARRWAAAAAVLVAPLALVQNRVATPTEPLPTALSDSAFWALSASLSEPAGYFRSDNLVGNEMTMQFPIPTLKARVPAGGVYLGVGPDQNFTYIAAIKPGIAFVVDIRQLNVMQHLFYKALFELSETRADFLARLFARPRPAGIDTTSSVEALMAAYAGLSPDSAYFAQTTQEVRRHLTQRHGFPLNADHIAGLDYVATAFLDAGPDLTYNFGTGRSGFGGSRYMPTYGNMMMSTDTSGVAHGYLASERHYQTIRTLQQRNLIVPVTGDFAGPKALRAVGDWVRRHDATISAFYTSNVEQYLFRSDSGWYRFFENVATMPTTSSSTFIRALFGRGGSYGMRSITLLCPIDQHVRAWRAGDLQSYYDVSVCPAP